MSRAAADRPVETRLSTERLLGTARRWRRRGAPVPASEADPGLFGPGSMAWEVLLHPATLVLETTAQGTMQLLYRPIAAGIRDADPISIKGQDGTLTFFDSFERFQRNSGMHAPMWLGNTETARRMADHLHRIHQHVTGELIDAGEPSLGGYAAAEPREAMWAALTELHPLLRAYEAFAFREGGLPHRLTPAQRDQYFREGAAYLRLVGAPTEEIPHSAAELADLYDRYADLFRHSGTMHDLPATGEDYQKVMAAAMIANFHPSQLRAVLPLVLLHVVWELPIMGALSGRARISAGYSPAKSLLARVSARLALPVVWVIQQSVVEKKILRLMWGPDAVELIEHARELHARAGGSDYRSHRTRSLSPEPSAPAARRAPGSPHPAHW